MKVEIHLPKSAKISFHLPKRVRFDETIFKIAKKKKEVLNIAKELKIEPEKIYNYLKKLIGERVEKGEILAEKKTLFSKKTFQSPFSGRVVEINHFSGTLTLETQEAESFEEFKGLQGEIVEKKGNKLVVDLKDLIALKVKKTNLPNLLAGRLSKIEKEKNFEKTDVENQIVLIEKTSDYIENKLLALKTKAIITLYPPKNKNLKFAQLSKVSDFSLAFENKKNFALIDPIQNMLYIYN